ncbi:MAG: hypothetical protein IK032_01625 [Bacteroidales bacterium]|nr:hypothetical protein [Bacteroidales bacterium]
MTQKDATRGLKNTLFLFLRMGVVLVISLYMSRLVLQALGFDDYGLYNVVGSVVAFLTFLNTALTNATSRYITYELGAGDNEKLNRTYSMAINTHAILALALLLIMETAGVWFVNYHLVIPPDRVAAANWCFQFSLLLFCVSIVKVPLHSNVIAHEKMSFYAFTSIGETVLKLILVIVMAHSAFDNLIFYSALLFAVSLIVLAVYVVYTRRVLTDTHYIRYWDKTMVKEFVSYSGYSMLVNGADGLTVQSRSIFFNWFSTALANAALGVANQVITLFNVFVDSFSQAFRPQIIKSYAAGDRGYFMQLIYSTSKIYYYLFLLITLPVLLNLRFVLTLWLSEYPPDTEPFVFAIVAYLIFDVFQMPLVTAVHATGKLRTHQIMISIIKIICIPVTYVALWLGGTPELTLYIWAALNFVCAVARTIYMRRLIGISLRRYATDVVLKMIAVTLVSVPLPLWLAWQIDNSWVQLVVTCLLSVLMVGLASFFIGINRQERQFVLSLPVVERVLSKFEPKPRI